MNSRDYALRQRLARLKGETPSSARPHRGHWTPATGIRGLCAEDADNLLRDRMHRNTIIRKEDALMQRDPVAGRWAKLHRLDAEAYLRRVLTARLVACPTGDGTARRTILLEALKALG